MAKSSRDKGKRGELEWCTVLRSNGFEAHRGVQYQGGPKSPDVVCPDLQFLHPEVKRVERLNIYDAIAQATRDAGADQYPYVAHRRNNHAWLVSMPLETFFFLVREAVDYGH